MKVIIAGKGRSLHFLCITFLSKGHSVTVIDRDHDECVRLAHRLKVIAIHGDASDPTVLDEAGVRGAHVVLAATSQDQDNLVICQIARVQFHVPRAVALVNDPDHEEIFRRLGVDAFSTTRTIASLIEQRAAIDDVTNLIPAWEGKVQITEVVVGDGSPVARRRLSEIELPPDSLVAVVLREGEPLVPRGSTQLLPADRVLLVALPASHGPALRAITGGAE